MAMAVPFVNIRENRLPVWHFAPEPGMQSVLMKRFGTRYIPADFSPELYSSWSQMPVQKVDLSYPNEYLTIGSVEGLVHSHILEHIPGSIERVISQMNDAIVPGGFHLFCVPIHPGWYREDMNPTMSAKEREDLFYQDDHLRVFGEEDFEDRCLRLFENDFTRIDLKTLIPDCSGQPNPDTLPRLFSYSIGVRYPNVECNRTLS
jgi:phosphoglycolate phosphatase